MLFSVTIVPGEQELDDHVAGVLVASGLVRWAGVDQPKESDWKRRKARLNIVPTPEELKRPGASSPGEKE